MYVYIGNIMYMQVIVYATLIGISSLANSGGMC